MSGIVLPQDKFGSHLNLNRETIAPELENKNFIQVGEIAAEIWSGMIIDRHPVLTKCINWGAVEEIPKKSLEWKSYRILESQYFFQVAKCEDENCCKPFRSFYLKIVKERFLLLPSAVTRSTISKLKCVKQDVDTHDHLSLSRNLALKANSVLLLWNIFRRAYHITIVVPLFKKWLTDNCVLYVVCTFHPFRKCRIINRYTQNRTEITTAPHPPSPHQFPSPPPKTRQRPQRVAAQRQRESCNVRFIFRVSGQCGVWWW